MRMRNIRLIIGVLLVLIAGIASAQTVDAAGNILYLANCGNSIFSTVAMTTSAPPPSAPAPTPAPRVRVEPPAIVPPVTINLEPLSPLDRRPATTTKQAIPPPPPPPEEPWFSVSVGYLFGPVNTKYFYPDPKRGDVPQHEAMSTAVFTVRLNRLPEALGPFSHIFIEESGTFAEKAKDIRYQDLQGNWNGKRQDRENSDVTVRQAKIGYGVPIGPIRAGVSANYNRFAMRDNYDAQDAHSEGCRCFTTWGLGLEARLAHAFVHTNEDDSTTTRWLTIAVNGTVPISGSRLKWMSQTYPGINFPEARDPKQDAKMKGVGVEGDFQVWGPWHVFGGVQWSYWSSRRLVAHPAEEETSARLAGGGLGLSW